MAGAVMSFAVYLSRTDLDGLERLFLLDNTENVDGNSCARDVLAVITTEDIQNEDESYKYCGIQQHEKGFYR